LGMWGKQDCFPALDIEVPILQGIAK